MYPDLYAAIGGTYGTYVPNYQGLFLRGLGDKAYNLGVRQNSEVYMEKGAGQTIHLDGITKGYYILRTGNDNNGDNSDSGNGIYTIPFLSQINFSKSSMTSLLYIFIHRLIVE